MKQVISGYTPDTAQNLLLNAGAWFKNFNVEIDTYKSAISAGKLLGATQGGGTFTATPEVRNIEIDGIMGNAKGATVYDGWTVTMQANIVEISADTFAIALGAANTDNESNEKYTVIKGKNYIEDTDYIDNVTWLGTLSGSDEPVIIQIYNALSTSGISMQTQDKSQAVLGATMTAHYDMWGDTADLDHAPFTIYYPKSLAAPIVNPVTIDDEEITGTGTSGAVVKVIGGTVPENTTVIVPPELTWQITIPAQDAGTILSVTQSKAGRTSLPVKVIVTEE